MTEKPPQTKWATGSNLAFVSYAADRNEGERVGELAVVLKEKQAVRLRSDQDAKVRRHARDKPNGGGHPRLARASRSRRQRGAQRALCDRIHRLDQPAGSIRKTALP